MHQNPARKTVAFIANLDTTQAVHATTFVRAINDVLENNLALTRKILPLWLNDHATEKGGQDAANEAIRQKANCVVGHYASAAAQAGLETYAKNSEIPVFLPAATGDNLVEIHSSAYRICPPDKALATALIGHLQEESKSSIYLQGDKSLHSSQLGQAIAEAAMKNGINCLTNKTKLQSPETPICYIGSFENSLHFLESHQNFVGDIYLTDDAVHPDLPEYCPPNLQALVKVIGFSPSEKYLQNKQVLNRYLNRWGEAPSTYYAQTYAATELALHIANNQIDINPIETSMGPLSLTGQELGQPEYSLWRILNGQLTAHPLPNQQIQKQPPIQQLGASS